MPAQDVRHRRSTGSSRPCSGAPGFPISQCRRFYQSIVLQQRANGSSLNAIDTGYGYNSGGIGAHSKAEFDVGLYQQAITILAARNSDRFTSRSQPGACSADSADRAIVDPRDSSVKNLKPPGGRRQTSTSSTGLATRAASARHSLSAICSVFWFACQTETIGEIWYGSIPTRRVKTITGDRRAVLSVWLRKRPPTTATPPQR